MLKSHHKISERELAINNELKKMIIFTADYMTCQLILNDLVCSLIKHGQCSVNNTSVRCPLLPEFQKMLYFIFLHVIRICKKMRMIIFAANS